MNYRNNATTIVNAGFDYLYIRVYICCVYILFDNIHVIVKHKCLFKQNFRQLRCFITVIFNLHNRCLCLAVYIVPIAVAVTHTDHLSHSIIP